MPPVTRKVKGLELALHNLSTSTKLAVTLPEHCKLALCSLVGLVVISHQQRQLQAPSFAHLFPIALSSYCRALLSSWTLLLELHNVYRTISPTAAVWN
jgi:hypothetical protein